TTWFTPRDEEKRGYPSGFAGVFLGEISYNINDCQRLTGLATISSNGRRDRLNRAVRLSLCFFYLQAAPANYALMSMH
ncbi:MAG: hypothetical protein WBF13_10530, partial [Candidatus Zixiibacteriota bacterium]